MHSCTSLKQSDSDVSMIESVKINPHGVDEQAVETGYWPEKEWWVEFEDNQLTAFIEKAFEGSPSLKAAGARFKSAVSEAKKSKAPFLPHFDLSVDDDFEVYSRDGLFRYYFPGFPSNTNVADLSLNFSYNLDLFGKDREKYQSSISQAKAQQAELSMSFLLLSTSIASVYFDMQSSYISLNLYTQLLDLYDEKLNLIEERFARGIVNQIRVDQALSLTRGMEESVIDQQKQLILYQNQIKFLMGLSPGDDLEIYEPVAHFNKPFPLPENIGLNLLSRRPDIRAQLMSVEAMAHLVKSAKAAYYPNINLSGLTGFNAVSWSKLLQWPNLTFTILPALDLPLYLGGELGASLDESRSNYSAAISDYNQSVLSAALEVSNNITELKAYSAQQDIQLQVIEDIENLVDLTIRRVQVGIDDKITGIDSEISLISSYLKDVNFQQKRHVSMVNLIKSLGGGYFDQGNNKESGEA